MQIQQTTAYFNVYKWLSARDHQVPVFGRGTRKPSNHKPNAYEALNDLRSSRCFSFFSSVYTQSGKCRRLRAWG